MAFKDRQDAQVCGQVAKWAGLFLVSPGDLGIFKITKLFIA